MCISTTPRNRAVLARPAVDVAQLLSHVDTNMVIKPTDLTLADNIVSDLGSNKKRNRHITVVHNYHDHSNAHAADYQVEHPARGGVTTPFPLKLHYMLLSTAQEGMEHVVSWQPHGRCFLVHKPKEFIEMLPRYFKLSKLASFQRQLNLYGFQRLTRGRDRGGYYHELFLRDREFIAHSITRIKVKGTGVRARSNPEQEPDFWGVLPWVAPDDAPKAKQLNEDDVVVAFGNKTFHFLEPFQAMETPLGLTKPQVHSASPAMVGSEFDDALLNGDAATFFQDFDFPETLGADIEDDDVFGNLLEQLIS